MQHDKPCGSCPFTKHSTPGALGGLTAETYVAMFLLPYFVRCQEHIDFSAGNWQEAASDPESEIPQCVGMSMCQNRGGMPEINPSALLKVSYDGETGAFPDIWDFWAHHKEISREKALEELDENRLAEICEAEFENAGHVLRDAELKPLPPAEVKERLMKFVKGPIAILCADRHQEPLVES